MSTATQSSGPSSFSEWNAGGVNPDVIPSNPASQLKVTFGEDLVSPSEELSVQSTQQEPQLEWAPQEAKEAGEQLYTVIMCDPDAPSRADPKYRCWLHWLVANVPSPSKIGEGVIVAPYQGPAPPPKTKLHRYVFLVYKQKGVIPPASLKKVSDDHRGGWKIGEFLKEHSSHIDGAAPIAGNFFQAQNKKQ